MHDQSWWDVLLTWLSENVFAALGLGLSGVIGFVTKNAMFRSGIAELREDWRRFEVRFALLEKERAEYRAMQAQRFDGIEERLGRVERQMSDMHTLNSLLAARLKAETEEQQNLFRLLREHDQRTT